MLDLSVVLIFCQQKCIRAWSVPGEKDLLLSKIQQDSVFIVP